jgi:hypothetical protein
VGPTHRTPSNSTASAAANFGFHSVRDCRAPNTNGKRSEVHAALGLAELDGWEGKRDGFRRRGATPANPSHTVARRLPVVDTLHQPREDTRQRTSSRQTPVKCHQPLYTWSPCALSYVSPVLHCRQRASTLSIRRRRRYTLFTSTVSTTRSLVCFGDADSIALHASGGEACGISDCFVGTPRAVPALTCARA